MTDLHVYTQGADPFVIEIGSVTLYVHQGSPGGPQGLGDDENDGKDKDKDKDDGGSGGEGGGARRTPVRKTPLKPPFRDLIVRDFTDMDLLSEPDVDEILVRMQGDAARHPRLDEVISELSQTDRDVQVHLVQDTDG